MFGGAIAQGEQQLAGGAQKAADFFGEVQTDDAVNGAMKTVNGTLDKFKSLQGADALRAQPQVQQDVDQAFQNARDGLSTPMQQKRYDDITRTYQDRYVAGLIRDHADQQAKTYTTQTNQNTMTNALTLVTNVADDPEKVDGALAMARISQIREVQNQGNSSDPEAVKAAVARADQAVYKTQAETIAVKDPSRALALVEQHKDVLGPLYYQMADQFRNRADQQDGAAAGNQAMGHAVAQSPVSGSFVDKVAGVEGTTPNPDSTASGTGQFVDATWKQMVGQYRPDLAAGKTPDQILAMRSDPALGREMVAHYAQLNTQQLQGAGIPATDSNLYLAHFLGGDGAVKALSVPDSTPVAAVVSPAAIQANPSVLAGKTVGDLKTWADTKMGGPATMKANAYANIMDRTDLSPQAKQYAITHINQQYQQAEIAANQNAQAVKQANDQAEGSWVPKILTNPAAIKPEDIANDPNLTPQSKITLTDVLQKHMKETQEGTAASYGTGFNDTLKAVTAPPGDPSRISDPNQILRMALPGPNGEPAALTLAGAEKLRGIVDSNKKPEGVGESQKISGALAYIKSHVSFEADNGYGPKTRDPIGEDLYNTGALPSFFTQYKAAQAAGGGTVPDTFWDRKNLDTLISPLKRTEAQIQRDMQLSAADVNPSDPTAARIPMKVTTQEDFNNLPPGTLFINPADGRTMVKNGPAKPAAPAVPAQGGD